MVVNIDDIVKKYESFEEFAEKVIGSTQRSIDIDKIAKIRVKMRELLEVVTEVFIMVDKEYEELKNKGDKIKQEG